MSKLFFISLQQTILYVELSCEKNGGLTENLTQELIKLATIKGSVHKIVQWYSEQSYIRLAKTYQ